jgi:hypothetical protein
MNVYAWITLVSMASLLGLAVVQKRLDFRFAPEGYPLLALGMLALITAFKVLLNTTPPPGEGAFL